MNGEMIQASEVRLGDVLVHYGVVFEIVSATCYPGHKGEETTKPCFVYRTRLLHYPGPSCAMPRA